MFMNTKNTFITYDDSSHIYTSGDLAFEESLFTDVSPVDTETVANGGQSKFFWLMGLVIVIGCLLVIRLGYLQLGDGTHFRALADGNRLRERVNLAPRGQIFDRYGNVLADSTASFRLLVTPSDLPAGVLAQATESVKRLLMLTDAQMVRGLDNVDTKSSKPIELATKLSTEQTVLFETHALEFPAMSIETVPVRNYVSSEAFSHVLGSTGAITDNDLASNDVYVSEDIVGKTGLELEYESELKGQNGKDIVEIDATGSVVKSLGEIQSSPGKSLKTTLDQGLQDELYKQFSSRPGAKGAAIAMNPKTGEVLALLSYPGYNTNQFALGISGKDYQSLLGDKMLPLFNRAIAGQLPPGSTVKPMVALAGLENGVITDKTVIVDSGKITIPNQFNPSVVYDYVGWKRTGLGPMTVRSAIAMSSDIFFYVVGGGLNSVHIDGLGIDRLAAFYRKFHLGNLTGIDLPGEKAGLVPDPTWKMSFYNNNALLGKWYLGDTYHVSIGQGDVLVTPLQMALWTATIANGGVGMKPHVVSAVLDKQGNVVRTIEPSILIPQVGSENNIRVVQEGMRQTVLSGTAKRLQSLSVSSAGKTGTAQFDNNEREHSWFTSFAPYENPEIVVTVLVEGGGEGGAAALPITESALRWWAEHRYQK